MAYMKPLYRRRCAECKSAATRVLCDRYNEEVNYYCARHGDDSLKAMQETGT